ncbi:MAG: hypothetical protein EHM45_22865, partial [Desulfobacteraceae bacterium]
DLRGAFVLPLDSVLRLKKPEETITVYEVRNGVEIDWVAHDIQKFARLMIRRNGYVLEQLYSPLIVIGGTFLDELKEIGQGCIIRHWMILLFGFDWSLAVVNANSFWKQNLILRIISGSRAYGLARADSDEDARGVCIPPKEYLIKPGEKTATRPAPTWKHATVMIPSMPCTCFDC